MLVAQKILLKPSNKNKKYYANLGYEFNNGEVIEVDIHDLPRESHMPVNAKCDICGKIHQRKAREVFRHRNHYCSIDCYSIKQSKDALSEFEKIIGDNAKDYLHQKYVVKKMTIRQIAEEVYRRNTGASTINRWLKTLGFVDELRHGSEAIKTQWVNNQKRRELSREITRTYMHTKASREKMKSTKQTEESKMKQRATKMGENNPMYGVVGEKSPQWNPNLTPEERIHKRKNTQNYKWIKNVYKRDDYTCQCCGYDKDGTLIAHHLNGYHWDVGNRFNVENGITLCEDCHQKFHKIYGYKFNTKEQFEEFSLNIR